ncbi:MAG: hypothetical protein RLZZ312_1416 [Bacteroidota bacterium]
MPHRPANAQIDFIFAKLIVQPNGLIRFGGKILLSAGLK